MEELDLFNNNTAADKLVQDLTTLGMSNNQKNLEFVSLFVGSGIKN